MKGERPLFPADQIVSDETRSRWDHRIQFILANAERLSDWEAAFAQDIEKRLADGRDLTLSQSAKLNEVFHKVEQMLG